VTDRPARILSAAEEAEALRKEQIVCEHKIRGWSFRRIEREFGFRNADRIWRRAVAKDENAGFLRAEAIRVEEERLDTLQDGIWDRALAGDARAVEVALKVLERRARLLGLDFADMISGQLVEVERSKVALMGSALVAALDRPGLGPDDKREIAAAFFEALRSSAARTPAALPPGGERFDEGLSTEDAALL
jgi:hypothetical protein